MNIRDAVLLAQKEGRYIYRTSEISDNGLTCDILPTNTLDCCLLIPTEDDEKFGRRWNPYANDLTAEDWEVH